MNVCCPLGILVVVLQRLACWARSPELRPSGWALTAAINELPADYRTVLVLRDVAVLECACSCPVYAFRYSNARSRTQIDTPLSIPRTRVFECAFESRYSP